ncbi:hypothetical protein SAMN04489751_3612 [Brevibacterium sandarakinum]|uniref:Uncharacterized protein n=1 Tax=Brevibacterium sandarakinum TaxID=629680 RepID=A0A1H1X8X4_BRESA|nr:hypothetical protein [Brevibacterium sandarakinum]SDT05029.1 hypothetical protein SAMN04489751_3612 [Brevibacterium sandarakinum]
MTELSNRAEQIAAHLVGHATGTKAIPYDTNGRQSAVDFLLDWPDGRLGALEVTLIVEAESIAWQGLASKEGWLWPAATSWEFRTSRVNFPYKQTRRVALRAVELCDQWSVDSPAELPAEVLADEQGLIQFLADNIGNLRRTHFRPGIRLYQSTRAEFMDAAAQDFGQVVESWHQQPHMGSHIEKLKKDPAVSERHLFLVAVDEALPARYFTDDFNAPSVVPKGFSGVDAIWVWSNFWHRYLRCQDKTWTWMPFPHIER